MKIVKRKRNKKITASEAELFCGNRIYKLAIYPANTWISITIYASLCWIMCVCAWWLHLHGEGLSGRRISETWPTPLRLMSCGISCPLHPTRLMVRGEEAAYDIRWNTCNYIYNMDLIKKSGQMVGCDDNPTNNTEHFLWYLWFAFLTPTHNKNRYTFRRYFFA